MTYFSKTVSALTVALSASIIMGCNGNDANLEATPTVTHSASTSTATDSNTSDSDSSVVTALQKNLDASGVETHVISATPTDMDGMYWVIAEGYPAFFTDKTGQHLIQGQIVQLGGSEPVDISTKLQAQAAKQQLANVPLEDMAIFPAKGETKAVVYAFTDADCGYCRKLHSEMDDINSRGIEVRYLAWPRSEQTIPKMEAIWCSEDRSAALTAAKNGVDIQPATSSCNSPVKAQTDLGLSLGVRGTPAIFTINGNQIGGYLPAEQLTQAAIAN